MSPETVSFDTLIRPHLSRLYRLAFRFTGDAADAEDLVQDVLIKIYRRRDELTSIDSLGPWLGRVLHNQFVDNARRYARRRLRTVSLDDPAQDALVAEALQDAAAPAPDGAVSAALDIRELAAALARLSSEHRTVLLMHDCEGYKLEEIQSITGVALGTVKSRLHRARARLRELLGMDGTF